MEDVMKTKTSPRIVCEKPRIVAEWGNNRIVGILYPVTDCDTGKKIRDDEEYALEVRSFDALGAPAWRKAQVANYTDMLMELARKLGEGSLRLSKTELFAEVAP
jgi:hypothetical protein